MRTFQGFRFETLEDRRLLAIGPVNLAAGEGLTTYKFALATTVEFTEAICSVSPSCTGSSSESVKRSVASGALDEIVSQINTVFQSELAVQLQLVPDNDLLISTGSTSSDGYSDSNTSALTSENGPEIESRLAGTTGAGQTNEYDLAHVFAVGAGGGLATLGVIGQSTKAQAASAVSSPVTLGQNNAVIATSSFLGIVLHEIGHQFGAEHSFNGTVGNCSQRAVESSYEPGSGSTIMSYGGV
ncbi:MAG: hypothetical protein KDB00_17755, partial [Planctomycetales bacterium]|nr:hypothetical protein [Planctomycetales bacterium]